MARRPATPASLPQVIAWLSSSAISIALSVLVLQPAKALMGSVLASVASTAAVATAIAAMALTTEMNAM